MSGAGLMCRIIEMYHFILRDLLCSYSLASDIFITIVFLVVPSPKMEFHYKLFLTTCF